MLWKPVFIDWISLHRKSAAKLFNTTILFHGAKDSKFSNVWSIICSIVLLDTIISCPFTYTFLTGYYKHGTIAKVDKYSQWETTWLLLNSNALYVGIPF